jgi:hypothetical protein
MGYRHSDRGFALSMRKGVLCDKRNAPTEVGNFIFYGQPTIRNAR